MNKNLANLEAAVDSIPLGDGTEWGTLYTSYNSTPSIILQDENAFKALGSQGGSSSEIIVYDINHVRHAVVKNRIIGFGFGRRCTYTPNNFGYAWGNLKSLTHTEVVKSIGHDNFSNITNTSTLALSFPNAEEIGERFVAFSLTFYGSVSLPKAKIIGGGFLQDCPRFTGAIRVPASVESFSGSFMANQTDFTGVVTIETFAIPPSNSLMSASTSSAAYKQGIRITGPGAAAWKAALPDSSSSPYRKLILIEE